jgi:IMP dehydrogenase
MENQASRERYGATSTKAFLAEGVESQVPFEGYVEDVLGLCIQALRKSMRYVKAPNIEYHRQNTRLFRITNQGLTESHPHSVDVISH